MIEYLFYIKYKSVVKGLSRLVFFSKEEPPVGKLSRKQTIFADFMGRFVNRPYVKFSCFPCFANFPGTCSLGKCAPALFRSSGLKRISPIPP